MCGITVMVQKNEADTLAETAFKAMVDAQKHRGPDGSHCVVLNWSQEIIRLGHNLLAISDAAEVAQQPFISENGTQGLVFNGQIYNHLALRTELQALGYRFKTHSDTETLLVWLTVFGRKGLRKLVGMYAFVFWDSKKEFLLIHRDNYGIKPLYFARNRNFLCFTSEPGALTSSGIMAFAPDETGISAALQYKFSPAPGSSWIGIRQLLPGEAIEYWEGKPMHYQVFHEPRPSDFSSIRSALDRAFESIIPSQQPFGLMFSGGVDSTLILHWCLQRKLPVEVFSIRFTFSTTLDADEKSVTDLSKRLGFQVHWVEIDLEDLYGLPHWFSKGKPLIADSAWWLSDRIAEAAKKKGLRILLSGAGADEWFAGYRRHYFFQQWLKLEGLIPGFLKERALSLFKSGRFRFNKTDARTPAGFWEWAVSSAFSGIVQKPVGLLLDSEKDPLEAALLWDRSNYLVQDILTLTDQATMAHGIEGRFPFLHPALTDFAASQSAQQLLQKGRKWFLASAIDEMLGFQFSRRKKQGFGLPLDLLFSAEAGKQWRIRSRSVIATHFPHLFKTEEFAAWWKESETNPANWNQENLAFCLLGDWLIINGMEKKG
jgi:asparagine synthase (glutamine-hydrolysing)